MTDCVTDMPGELLPCPFCAGAAELDTMQGYRALAGSHIGNRTAVYCTECTADVGMCHEDMHEYRPEDITAYVVAMWNTRVPRSLKWPTITPAEADRRMEQLVAIVEGKTQEEAQ